MNIKIQLNAFIPPHILTEAYKGNVLASFSKLLPLDEAVETIRSLENRTNIDALCKFIDESKVLIVFSNFFYDVFDKVTALKNEFGFKVIFITPTPDIIHDPVSGDINANLVDVINFVFSRKNRANILFFSVNPVWKLLLPYLFRTMFPEIKILLYKYDWLTLFCPFSHRSLLKGLLRLPEEYIDYEYRVFDMILQGDIVDGILYKDGGYDFRLLHNYLGKKLYFPAFLPHTLYQPIITSPKPHRRFVYIGKLFSPLDYVPELFTDAFLFKPFRAVSFQNCSIDAYYARSSKVTVQEYENAFSGDSRINILEGMPLNRLLGVIAGKYHYGYLINNYDDDYSIIKAHVENALPARIFTFMALGIPCLVSEELTFTAQFVQKNGIGLAVPYKKLSDLTSIIDSTDYNSLQNNISHLREELCFERQAHKFIDFVQTIFEDRK